jgi:hypothetical protein
MKQQSSSVPLCRYLDANETSGVDIAVIGTANAAAALCRIAKMNSADEASDAVTPDIPWVACNVVVKLEVVYNVGLSDKVEGVPFGR